MELARLRRIVVARRHGLVRQWDDFFGIHEPDARPRAVAASVEGSTLRVRIADGREPLVPVAWFPWLAAADTDERDDASIDEGGLSLWWARLEDGLSVPRLFGLPEWP